MKVIVNKHKVIAVREEPINQNEINVSKCSFDFSPDYDLYKNLVKVALFTVDDKIYKKIIFNNQCDYPPEILEVDDMVTLGVYAYETINDEEIIRFSPAPDYFYVDLGSYKEDAENSKPITPSELEQFEQELNKEVKGAIEIIKKEIETIDLDDYVKKEEGKGLSTNDFTNEDKNKLDSLENYDDTNIKNSITDINKNIENIDGSITNINTDIESINTNKADKSEIPEKLSQLTNDTNFVTNEVDDLINYYNKTTTYNKEEIDAKISSVYKYKGSVNTKNDLPNENLTIGDVYNIIENDMNVAWTGEEWDNLGSSVDLTNYIKNTDYATTSKAGIIGVSNYYSTNVSGSNGVLYCNTLDYESYKNKDNAAFISKGTLKNVIEAELNNTIGNINTILATLTTPTTPNGGGE